jgi:hypothetical protein
VSQLCSELEYHRLLTRHLSVLAEKDYGQLTLEVIEIKRMVASFTQKLNADR